MGALLTYFAVLVSAGLIRSGTGGVQIDADTLLGPTSTDKDLASVLHSSLVLLLPIAAAVIGARLAGSEMSSGALLTIAVAVRRLRGLIGARIVVLVALLTGVAMLTTALVCTAAFIALSGVTSLGRLSASAYIGPLMLGAVVQTVTLGLLTFALAALTRRCVPVVIGAIVYIVALEPVVQGLAGGDLDWLPRAATSALVSADAQWRPLLPVAIAVLILTTVTVLTFRRDRAFK